MKIHEKLDNIIPDFVFTDIKYLFRGVNKDDLHEVWDMIQPELLKTLRYSPEENICSGDVFCLLRDTNNTQLYIVEDYDNEYVGFFIIQIVQEKKSKKLHIWLAGTKKMGVFNEIGKMAFNIARHNKCNRISASSTREAMGIALSNFGMKPKFVTYEMEI